MRKPFHSLFFARSTSNIQAELGTEEIRHATSVMRMKAGDTLSATDGKGTLLTCTITESSSSTGVVAISERHAVARCRPEIHCKVGLPERDAFETIVTDLTALGVASITPVVCAFCQKKWWDPWEKQAERMGRKMVAALKQSLGAWLPELSPPKLFSQAMASVNNTTGDLCIVAGAGGQAIVPVVTAARNCAVITCFIGPPGGFSPEETATFASAQWTKVGLGPTRLRTELAATVMCGSVLQGICQSVISV